jgi:uncharacterized protein
MVRFFQYQLRTTDVDAARAFYAAVLGRSDAVVFRLHEQALARGARPHWLGFLDVGEVDSAVSAFVARGAIPLGPKLVSAEGLEVALIRDPGGAVVALAKRPRMPDGNEATNASDPGVVWQTLNTADVDTAKINYRELLGWHFEEPLDRGSLGVFHPFAWQAGGAPVGSMSDIGQRTGVHPHWLFHLRVASLDLALDAVRGGGGVALDPIVLPSGERIAVCDDPQGAAFALHES